MPILAEQTKQTLLDAADGQLMVSKLEKKQQNRNPAPPFITSTLQQEAARVSWALPPSAP